MEGLGKKERKGAGLFLNCLECFLCTIVWRFNKLIIEIVREEWQVSDAVQ
jgi:hypothetical protein